MYLCCSARASPSRFVASSKSIPYLMAALDESVNFNSGLGTIMVLHALVLLFLRHLRQWRGDLPWPDVVESAVQTRS
jgi:hypothetical protein